MPAYFTYITPKCKEEARKHSVLSDIEKLSEKIEHTQDVGNLSFFPRIFRKKALGKSFRLIIGEVPYEGEADASLFVFWHVFPKSHPKYKTFQVDSQSFEAEFKHDYGKLDLKRIWQGKLDSPPPGVLPKELSKAEKDFLWALGGRTDEIDDWIVLESEDWTERTNPEKYAEPHNLGTRLSDISSLVSDAISTDDADACFISNNRDVGVLYKKMPAEKMIFLIAPVKAHDEAEKERLKIKYRDILDAIKRESLHRKSKRSYPSLVLADQDLWERIEKADEKANLSLSAEEAEILQKCQHGHYPLFINGRPGSGKSTILQYLFAEHLYDYIPLANRLQAPPLYLTYSRDLLDTAQGNVEAILKGNAYHNLRDNTCSEEVLDALLQSSFHTLKEYLYNLLPENKKRRFSENGYIRFPEFRLWYGKTFGRDASLSDVSAELAWHVIRSYIKGLSSDTGEYLDEVDDFYELPGEKSVTSQTFERIAGQIWHRYREWCQEKQYWDDQDLVREVLASWGEKEIQIPEHVAVFCDEAQDYSLNELRLIFRLSLYSHRRLTPDILNRLPFAFAGDPFQTLNPTGFDWGTISGNFYITIRDQLSTQHHSNLKIQFEELTFNYRSRIDIVQLCNLIHLYRGIAFNKRGLEPQETWFQQASDTPVYFDIESDVFQSKVRQQEETIIILPCQEGEELSFVGRDPFLAQFAEDGKFTRNIISPMRAKGLEYQRVVLYKFGDVCLEDYPNLLKSLDAKRPVENATPDEVLPLEYFINRLYVAASRARKRLIIADTQGGLEQFWKRCFENANLDEVIDAYRSLASTEKWETKHLVKIQPGRQQDWEGDRDRPLDLARDFEKRGRANKDIFLLERAANNYRLAKQEDDALRCDAWRLGFQEKLLEAGEIWQKLGEGDKAKDLYWKAQAFDRLARFDDGSLQQRAAQFMHARESVSFNDVRQLIEDVDEVLGSGRIQPDGVWRKVISALYRDLLNKSTQDFLKPYEWEALWQKAEALRRKELLERDEEVIQIQLRATPYPEKLEVLHKFNSKAEDIVVLYRNHTSEDLSDEQVDIVMQALRTLNADDELETLVEHYASVSRYASLIAHYAQRATIELEKERRKHCEERIQYWAERLLGHFVQEADWDAALDFVKGKRLRTLDEKDSEVVRNYRWPRYCLDIPFIRLLSVSPELAKAGRSDQNQISKYLSDLLTKETEFFAQRLTIQQAGVALERTGKVMDSLQFYESIWQWQNWPASEEDMQFARERWLVCKKRQIDITDSNNRKREIISEIRRRAEAWKVDPADLPEFPEVDLDARPQVVSGKPTARPIFTPEGVLERDSLQTSESTDESPHELTSLQSDTSQSPAKDYQLRPKVKIGFVVGEQAFQCTLDRTRGKMTVKLEDEMEMVTFTAKDLDAQGSDDEFGDQIQTLKRSRSRAEYYIACWNLTCVLRSARRRHQVVYADLYLGKKEFELFSLRLAE